MNEIVTVFEGKEIRRVWFNDKWYFSVVDVIEVLTGSSVPRRYWSDLKKKLAEEADNEQLYEKIVQLKMPATDGKNYKTDAADVETMFRIIQSIPSPRAEPFKLWLAKVGYERIQEISDPEISINRARDNYKKLGRTESWIQRRMMGQETRNKLTDYWKNHEISTQQEYAILTNIIHEEWTDLSVRKHKKLKGLTTQNLRDHMSEAELLFTALAELSTRQVAEKSQATGMAENKKSAKIGGGVAKRARKDFEHQTGQQVVSSENYLQNKSSMKLVSSTDECEEDQEETD